MRSQPVALLGEAPPRVLVEPKGARANSWEDVADLSARAGIVLDEWQEVILQAAMGERADATWAAKRVGVSVPRQNGKSQLLVARALAGVLLFEEKKIVISAHQADTARESFGKMLEILEADGNGWLMDRVKGEGLRKSGIMNALNREAIKFKNGATVQFKARTGSGGRGFSSDCLMLDEAQRLKRPAWVSINSTMSAMPNPQVWLLGTPPTREDVDAQMGEVFASIRASASVSTATAWCEWGADPKRPEFVEVKKPAPRIWSPELEALCWSANPAWNTRINHEVVQGEAESYTSEELAQDRLGVWLDDLGGGGVRAFPDDVWNAPGAVVDGPPAGELTYAVAFSVKGDRMSLAGHVGSADSGHVELIDSTTEVDSGLAALADWFVSENAAGIVRWRRMKVVVLSGSAGAGVLRQYLVDRGVPPLRILTASTAQYLQACGMFREAVEKERSVTHLSGEGQEALDESVSITDTDRRGGWIPSTPDGDETPLEAVSLALWGARTSKLRPAGGAKRKALVFG